MYVNVYYNMSERIFVGRITIHYRLTLIFSLYRKRTTCQSLLTLKRQEEINNIKSTACKQFDNAISFALLITEVRERLSGTSLRL